MIKYLMVTAYSGMVVVSRVHATSGTAPSRGPFGCILHILLSALMRVFSLIPGSSGLRDLNRGNGYRSNNAGYQALGQDRILIYDSGEDRHGCGVLTVTSLGVRLRKLLPRVPLGVVYVVTNYV